MKLRKRILAICISIAALLGIGASVFATVAVKKQAEETKAISQRTLVMEYELDKNHVGEDTDTLTHAIGKFKFGFKCTYNGATKQIFTTTGYYLNDHLDDAKDENGDTINLGDGILINGKPFRYWVNYSTTDTYSRAKYVYSGSAKSNGVHDSPQYNYGVFSPVLIYIGLDRIEFTLNRAYFELDSIQITFVKDVFCGYYATSDYKYNLAEDANFYSTLSSESGVSVRKKVVFVTSRNETPFAGHIIHIDTSSQTNYVRYTLWTDIVRDDVMTADGGFLADHHRYLYDNLLLCGKSFAWYNMWARGNSKDFTDLTDSTSQNPDYTTSHPTGSANPKYDLALVCNFMLDQTNYVFGVNVPNQLVTDLGLGTITNDSFAVRTGSAWYSKVNDEAVTVRLSQVGYAYDRVVDDFIAKRMHPEIPASNNNDTGACRGENGYYAKAKASLAELTDEQENIFKTNVNYADMKARYNAWAAAAGDNNPYRTSIISKTNSFVDSNNSFVTLAIVFVMSISCVGLLLVIKKRKSN